MASEKNTLFTSRLEAALRKAGLPPDPKTVIGRIYQFGCEHDSHRCALSGTIEAVELWRDDALILYVANPGFCGWPLASITYSNGRWTARVRLDETPRNVRGSNFFEGEFTLL